MLVRLRTCPLYQLLSRKLRKVVYLFRVNLSLVLNWPLTSMVIKATYATMVFPKLGLAITVKVSSG